MAGRKEGSEEGEKSPLFEQNQFCDSRSIVETVLNELFLSAGSE